jgi:pyruvate dehydrogenase E2 component (dihydrolipoamide acetyltransferase)
LCSGLKRCLAAGYDAQEDGILAKILVAEGTTDIPLGKAIAILVDSAEDVAAFANYSGPEHSTITSMPTSSDHQEFSKPEAPVAAAAPASDHSGGPSSGPWLARLGPAVRTALALRGLLACDVTPTGPRGIITKGDVLAAATNASAKSAKGDTAWTPGQIGSGNPAKTLQAPVAADAAVPGRVPRGVERYTDVPVTQMRRVIAKRLLQSKLTIPAIYVSAVARLDALSHLRSTLKEAGVKVSVNDCVLSAVAKALRKVPAACAGWDPKRGEAVSYEDVDISVAVATDGGLITPIVKAADRKSIGEIGAVVRDLAGAVLAMLSANVEWVMSYDLYGSGRLTMAERAPSAKPFDR